MFHILAYTSSPTAAVTLTDLAAAVDPSFSIRNGHFILTEPYNLLAALAAGATLTAVEFKIPSVNAIAPDNIYPWNEAVTIAANPNIDDRRLYRPPIPMNEEIQVLASDSAAEAIVSLLWLGTPGWTDSLGGVGMGMGGGGPVGRRLNLLVTATPTKIANAWSADAALTFEQSLRAGVYAVLGIDAFAAGCLAFRVNFFVNKPYGASRKLFPGDICIQAQGNQPKRQGRNWLGIWGYFHNFEPPSISVWGSAAGAVTVTSYWDVVYLGGTPSDLQSAVASLAT